MSGLDPFLSRYKFVCGETTVLFYQGERLLKTFLCPGLWYPQRIIPGLMWQTEATGVK